MGKNRILLLVSLFSYLSCFLLSFSLTLSLSLSLSLSPSLLLFLPLWDDENGCATVQPLTFNNYDGFVLLSGDRKKNKEENCHRQYGNNETNQQTRAMAGHNWKIR